MAEVISRRSIVYDILFEVEKGKKSAKQAQDELGKIEKSATGLNSTMTKLGGVLAATFAVERLINFSKEAVILASKAEGVRKAFNRLDDPGLLNNLRTATKGTISDITLMQAAVRADKFKVPLKQLGDLFAFARNRARETGQSVDFLVNSIVDGIGRKSTLILDNLGISAVQLQQEFKKTGDFGQAAANIIRDEMLLAGDAIETSADSFARFNAAVENFSEQIGTKLLPFITEFVEGLVIMNEAFTLSKQPQREFIDETDKLRNAIKNGTLTTEDMIKELSDLQRVLEVVQTDGIGETDVLIESLTTRIDLLNAALNKVQATSPDALGLELEMFGDKLREAFRGEIPINVRAFSDELTNLNKKILESDLPRNKLLLFTKQVEELKKAFDALIGEGGTPLAVELEKIVFSIDDILAKTKEVNNVLFDLPDEVLSEESTADFAARIKLQQDALEALRETAIRTAFDTADALSGLAKDGSAAQLALTVAAALGNQAQAISAAIAAATQAAAATGVAAPFTQPAFIATMVGTVLTGFAQVFSTIKQAQSQIGRFAEGTDYLERGKNPKGTDTIPIYANEGEAIIPTEKNMKYWGLSNAMINDNVEEWVKKNYSPTLAVQALDHAVADSRVPDYSTRFYKQLLATGEHINTSKKQVKILSSIDNKLSPKPYLKRYSR